MVDKILKFSASWCAPCKFLATALEGEELGVPLEEVDIDEQGDLAGKFNIRGVPTLVYVRGGTEVGRLAGANSIKQVRDWIATI